MGNEIKVFVGGTEYRLTDPGAQAEVDTWKARVEKAEAAQDKAILERDRDVAQAESDRDDALVSLNGQLRDLEYECAKASKERDGWKARAEKAERERDAYKRDLDAEFSGNAALRLDFGARDDETMCEFVARLVRERDEAGWLPASACCKSCEGPLTCAKCTAKEHPSSRLNDHEARIKALESRVILEMEE
jgi:hypothetical protein